MALSNDTMTYWRWGLPPRHARCYSLKASTRLFKGAVGLQVNGVAQNMVSGAAMAALCQTFAGGDANSGLTISARQPNVRVALISGAAESINIVYNAAPGTTDVNVTYNNGVSTALTVANLIRGNAEADRLLRVKHTGTGAGTALVAAAATAVPFIGMLGAASAQFDNSAGVTTLSVDKPGMVFDQGILMTQALSTDAPAVGFSGEVGFTDENTTHATVDPLDIVAPLKDMDGARCYVDLAAAR